MPYGEEKNDVHIGDQKNGSCNSCLHLKVSFFGPFYGGYHIIALDRQNYNYAMVTGPSRSYLWVLSRSRKLEEPIYQKLVALADKSGFDTNQLIRVVHNLPDE
jgi:apolipoprotein D and lipocalin family protein